jgi:hypothetical protein
MVIAGQDPEVVQAWEEEVIAKQHRKDQQQVITPIQSTLTCHDRTIPFSQYLEAKVKGGTSKHVDEVEISKGVDSSSSTDAKRKLVVERVARKSTVIELEVRKK